MVDITDMSDYRSLASVLGEGQRQQAEQIKLRQLQKQQAQGALLNDVIKRYTTVDATSGAAATDQQAVLGELYRKDPEVARAYESDVAARQVETLKAKQAATTYNQGQTDRNTKLTLQALSAVDENGDQAVAAQQYADGVRQLKAAGVPIDPSDEAYSRGRVAFLKRQAIGAEKMYTEQNDLDQNKYTQDAGIQKTQINADAGIKRAQITGDASIRRAAVTGDASVQRAQITASSKKVDDGTPGGTIDLLGVTGPQTSGFGNRRDPLTGGTRFHGGVDIAKPLNTPVPAADTGEVVFAGKKGGYGNQVRIKYANGREISYSHLNDTRGLKAGDNVSKGQVVGLTGSTGRSTGPHLHVEEYGDNGERVNPKEAVVAPAAAVAKAVMTGTRPSRLTKQGEISLRTLPAYKTLSGTNFDAAKMNMDRVLQLLDNGANTGPGSGIKNAIDKTAVGLRNVIGVGLPGVDEDKAENRATAYALLDKVATTAGIEALAGIGGNDTDRDFDRALKTTVNNLQTRKFNYETAVVTRELLQLASEKKSFYERWANTAGSPSQTINGQTLTEAWDAYAKPRTAEIARKAQSTASSSNLPGSSAPRSAKPSSSPIQVRSSADYARAPKGSIVVWNGKQYRKP